MFDVFRDRQITKKNTTSERKKGLLRVIKARNIQDDGSILSIEGYDSFIEPEICQDFAVAKYIVDLNVYLTPNMTYNPRVICNKTGLVPDGSVAVLIPKQQMKLTQIQISFFATEKYRKFYQIARNLSTQSINIDSKSVFFYGVKK